MEASKYVDMFRENVDENTFKLIDGKKVRIPLMKNMMVIV